MELLVSSGMRPGKALTYKQRTCPVFSDCPRIGNRYVPPYGSIKLSPSEVQYHANWLHQLIAGEVVECKLLHHGVELPLPPDIDWSKVDFARFSEHMLQDEPRSDSKPAENLEELTKEETIPVAGTEFDPTLPETLQAQPEPQGAPEAPEQGQVTPEANPEPQELAPAPQEAVPAVTSAESAADPDPEPKHETRSRKGRGK